MKALLYKKRNDMSSEKNVSRETFVSLDFNLPTSR